MRHFLPSGQKSWLQTDRVGQSNADADGTKLPFSLGVTLCGSVAGPLSTEHELDLNRSWTGLCSFVKGTHFRNDEWPRLEFVNKT